MSDRTFSADEKVKLTKLVNEGMRVLQEVTDLQEGLRETVKAIAEEINVKPSLLTKAIKTAYKSSFSEQQSEIEDLETILVTVGRKV